LGKKYLYRTNLSSKQKAKPPLLYFNTCRANAYTYMTYIRNRLMKYSDKAVQ